MPTVLEIMGRDIPTHVQGTSLLPAMRDPKTSQARDFAVSTIPFANVDETIRSVDNVERSMSASQVTTITSGGYSLLYSMDPGRSQLFHLPTDPGQQSRHHQRQHQHRKRTPSTPPEIHARHQRPTTTHRHPTRTQDVIAAIIFPFITISYLCRTNPQHPNYHFPLPSPHPGLTTSRVSTPSGETILTSGWRPTAILGISRGGLVLAAMLSYMLDVRNVHTVRVEHYDDQNKRLLSGARFLNDPQPFASINITSERLLIVDAIVDTGETLKLVRQAAQDHAQQIRGSRSLRTPKPATRRRLVLESHRRNGSYFPWAPED